MATRDDDGFEYTELPVEEDFAELPPDEEDVQSIVRALARKATGEPSLGDAGASVRGGRGTAGGASVSVEAVPSTADDYIRNFLIRAKMYAALDAFNTEWYEFKARGTLPGADVLAVPDAHSANAVLETTVARLRVELASAQDIAGKAQATWDRFRRERDFHRMHHKRVMQEKNKLISDLRRLKTHYEQYEPTMAELRAKYELAMKEKALMRLERDRLSARAVALESHLRAATTGGRGGSDEPVASGAAAAAPSSSPTKGAGAAGAGASAVAALAAKPRAGGATAHTALSSARFTEKTAARRGAAEPSASGAESRLPPDDLVNPFLSLVFEPAHADSYRLTGTVRAHSAALSSLTIHPTKPVVCTASDDASWRMWALTSASSAELVMNGEGHRTWLADCDFHPNGTTLATAGGDGLIKLWSLTSAQCSATLHDHTQPVWSVAWHHAGDFLASASMDQTAKLWDAHTGKVRQSFRGHVDSVNALFFQPCSNLLATASGDKTVSVWDARSGLCVQTFYGHTNAVNDVAFNLRGDTLVSADADGSVRVWDVRMVAERASASVGRQAIHGVALDRSGLRIATACDDGVVRVFDAGGSGVGGLGLVSSLRGHEDACQDVAFDPTSQYLLSAGSDATMRIWSEGIVKAADLGAN